MISRLSVLAAAAVLSIGAPAMAQSGIDFRVSGYGTVGAVHTNETGADFVGDRFQPKGAGHTESWSFNPDTRFGLQGNARFNEQFSGVVQIVSKQQYDNSWTPNVEWANLKWQPTSNVDLRAGRIAAPSYLLSESRFVGYASTTLRVPQEVYGVLAITSNDGVDATWRRQIGSANHSVQAFYGKSTAKLGTATVKAKASWGINDTVEIGSLTLRAGYNVLDIDLQVSSFDTLLNGLRQFAAGAGAVPMAGFQTAAAQAQDLARVMDAHDMKLKAVALGVSYDPGSWITMAEYVKLKGEAVLPDSSSWYVMGGVRVGNFTPYVMFASTRADTRYVTPIDTSGAPPLAASGAALSGGVIAVQQSQDADQDTTSLGLRWDFMKNVAAKVQLDRVSLKGNSAGRFHTIPGVAFTSRTVNLVSVAVDFVF